MDHHAPRRRRVWRQQEPRCQDSWTDLSLATKAGKRDDRTTISRAQPLRQIVTSLSLHNANASMLHEDLRNDCSWIVNDHHDRFRIDRGFCSRYSFNLSSLGLSFPRIYVIGDLQSDSSSEESIPSCPPPTLTKWISYLMPLSSGGHAAIASQDEPGQNLSGTRV